MTPSVLVIEDESNIRELVALHLRLEEMTPVEAPDGNVGLEQARARRFDLVILDLMLPGLDGVTLCRAIRRDSQNAETPILMLTARREESDKVLGLDSGADDYLVKPFEVDELVARVNALIRRSKGMQKLVFGPLEIDRAGHRAVLGGVPLDLTLREYTLLMHLAHHAGRIVTRTDLLAQVWETGFDSGSNVVDVQISRLRDKLGAHSFMIETVRGFGYRLRAEPST